MTSSKTMVKQTVSKDFDLRRSPGANTGSPGRKVGEQMHVEVTPDRIRVRAYEIYQARNGAPGDELSDWRQAEAELNGRAASGLVSEALGADSAPLEIRTRSEARRQPVA